ncbi:GATA-type zinc finger protein 1 [Xyrichtys novacula]|uniref:GATA-type zinc finger protein 1 n=1 Tax=Xyrichtys novacula TaxID=13765 RepID=A0AAV1EXY8_XYRNO|nr:GATA-type zinc finger protein 1 [Xyrichtys novacula]
MSTGPRTQAAFIQGNHTAVDQDASHPALFYLFQEVAKLSSPIHNSFLHTNSTSTWLNETSGEIPLIVKEEEEDAQSLNIPNSSPQHGFSCLSPYKQIERVNLESYSSKDTASLHLHPECNSPWEALSLINLQCEQLLNHSDEEESEQSFVTSAAKLGNSIDSASTISADETDQGGNSQILTADVSSSKDRKGVCSRGADGCKPPCCVEDSEMGLCDLAQTAEKPNTLRQEQAEENVCTSSQRHKDTKIDESGQIGLYQACNNCVSTKGDVLNVLLNENTKLRFNSNEQTNAVLSKPVQTLDHNENLVTAELQSDTKPPPLSSGLLVNTAEPCHSLSNQDDIFTASRSGYSGAPIEDKPAQVAQLKFSNPSYSATQELESRPARQEEFASLSTQKWKTKTPRKQRHPSRSVDIQDPDFQGVIFRMDTELEGGQCRLLITSKYSKELRKSVKKPKLRTRTTQRSLRTSSPMTGASSERISSTCKDKMCASCCTTKTPVWRDAEDGTPLCNACGIRYKKYRVRCANCWHIPRKESNSNSCCLKCGNFVKLTSAQRKHTV